MGTAMLDLSRDDLVRFARRDWTAIARAKERHWLRWKRAMTAADLWRLSDDLLRHARARPGREWPQADRLADLSVHQRVGQALRAVTRAAR
jgi:hypothetical protein